MLLGYARGSVGDVTFFRSKGAQKARARNRKPANPKTEKQVIQRAYFADAVRFFKQCNSNFFKFAYEDRKVNESDYNAFMRHNVKRAELIGYNANRAIGYPALGLWEVSAGTLHGAMYDPSATPEVAFSYDLGASKPAEALATVGALSSHLIENAPNIWRAGDIVTILTYECVPGDAHIPDVNPAINFDLQVRPFQFILDTADTTSLRYINGSNGWGLYVNTSASDGFWLDVSPLDPTAPQPAETRMTTNIIGCAVIQSRNVAGGLLVSTSDLIWNEKGSQAILETKTAEYRAEILNDWQAAAPAVLQGALAEEYENPFDRATAISVSLQGAVNGSGSGGDAAFYNAPDNVGVGQTAVIHNISNSKPYIRSVMCIIEFPTAADAAKAEEAVRNATATYLDQTYDCIADLSIYENTLTVHYKLPTPNTSVMQGGIMRMEIDGVLLVNVDINYSLYATETGIGGHGQTVPAPGTEEVPLNAPDNAYSYHFKLSAAETISQNDFILATPTNVGVEIASNISVQQDSGGYHVVEVDYPTAATTGWAVGNVLYLMYKNSPIAKIIVTAAE